MVPKPIANNAQVQRLTTALKNICRDYPAGGGVLRELLQNADDAGATEVRFILDERTYPTEHLIHEELQKYQGAALLVYNNSTFTDQDFLNLSRLGDSLKVQDGLTTGRFGRGFNSVYNWTDSPSIVSRERLLILDPHHKYSLGGDVYDFVENFEDIAIRNHMAAFQTALENSESRLDGTIIRIPLRTQLQAAESEISDRETTVSEVQEVLQKFAAEFGDSGLLFLRNIEKVGIETSSGVSIEIEIADREKIRLHKSKVNKALEIALNSLDYSFNLSFELQIDHRSTEGSRRSCFIVHHSIDGGSMDSSLQDWAKDQKLIPWVAVAAHHPCIETTQGSLFTVLPLPIVINQPVHIHGLFSISPDRARLYKLTDSSIQDQSQARWNDWLFHSRVPIAWSRLLVRLAQLYPHKSSFDWWPQSLDDPHDHLADAIENIVEIINKKSLPLFATGTGYVKADTGFLHTGKESMVLRDALQEAKVPIVYIPERLRNKVEHLFNDRVLSPQKVCHFLKIHNSRVKDLKDVTKQIILEYLLSKPGCSDYGTLELFPFEDGEDRSVADHLTFVHRDALERDLFRLENFRNIDLDSVTAPTKQALKEGCENSTIHKSIRYRSITDFRDYSQSFVFKKIEAGQDVVVLDTDAVRYVSKAWAWIAKQHINILDAIISDLWLIPLTNGRYRKVVPRNSSSETILAPPGEIGDLLRNFDAKSSSKIRPLLDTSPRGLLPESSKLLMRAAGRNSKMLIKHGGNVVHLAEWLSTISAIVNSASSDEKDLVVKLLASNLPCPLRSLDSETIANAFSNLEIFKKVSWKVEGEQTVPDLEWTNLSASRLSISLVEGIIPVPPIDNVQFLDAPWLSSHQKLLKELRPANCLTTKDIIERYIIPAWKGNQVGSWSNFCKKQVAKLLFRNYSCLSRASQSEFRTLPMIPVVRINGEATSKFAVPGDLIDPSITDLKGLFFDDEEVLPTDTFWDQFHVTLKGCGLKTEVDEDLVESRARCYASSGRPGSEIQQRAYGLLKSAYRSTSSVNYSELRQLKWLPILDLEGILRLKAPDQCRGSGDRLLVSFQLPILEMPISTEWELRLGWCEKLPNHILLAQLNQGLQQNDRAVVDAVLTYIDRKGQTNQLADDLLKIRCILTSTGLFVKPSQAFRPPPKTSPFGCQRLHPYLGNVDSKFWQDHETLLHKLNIGREPLIEDLIGVQKTLETKVHLDAADVAVAIEILNLASEFQSTLFFSQLKVLSKAGNFCKIQEIHYNDIGSLTPVEKVNLTHPNIPYNTIQKLGIELLSQLVIKGLLDIEDIDDEDEYDQREQVTTRIVDTLDRYHVKTTFREYLANADDTKGATKISWLLDERTHASKMLLTPELSKFQGPALLVHNDGVFSDDDLRGFKNVGEGSKMHDKETIGQFGRGSQTMYHWTDVPMVLSGRYLLILDPQREVLWRNNFTGKRMSGMKVELSKLKTIYPNQLAPFEGLWDYHQDLDNYPGTVFRFPLRPENHQSKLRVNETELDVERVRSLLADYFNEARISLLFLRRIRSIDFRIHGKSNYGWSISRQAHEDSMFFSDWVHCSFANDVDLNTHVTGEDKWWVAIEDVRPETDHLPYSPRRVLKNVECGIAALVSSKAHNSVCSPKILKPQMFSTLPLRILLDLPIYIHATFALSGDRQSLILDEHGSESHGSAWNRYLLERALPTLYLAFLDDLGTKVPQGVFKFWPQVAPPLRSCSEILCSSFWKELPKSSRRLFPKALPVSGLRQRQPPVLFDINEAIFDFLPKGHSDILAPLLLSLEVKIVRHIPKEVQSHLKGLSQVKSITGPMLRKLFKSEEGRLALQDEMSRNPSILETVFDQAIPVGRDLEDLDGCGILPLADGTLGTVRLIRSSSTATTYYVATQSEIELFKFASSLLASPSKLLLRVPIGEDFNLEKLKLFHVSKLLDKRIWPTVVNPQAQKWLTDFWDFWNKSEDTLVTSQKACIEGYPISLATYSGIEAYLRPSQLQKLPAVVEPSVQSHQQLCQKIPGLYRFNNMFMSRTLKENEESFDKAASFHRFISAIRTLAVKNKVELGVFVKTHLDTADLKVFRSLVICHSSFKFDSRNPQHQEFSRLKTDLRSVPLWPSCDRASSDLMPAKSVLRAESHHYLVPWMKRYPQFMDPHMANEPSNQNCLSNLEIEPITVRSLFDNDDFILPLPAMSSDLNWGYYKRLIVAVSLISLSPENWYSVRPILTKSKIAGDVNRVLHKASELFDHEDVVFKSAFRGQHDNRFLHNEIRERRLFWLKIGLRRRENGVFNPADYLQSVQAISRRLAARDRNLDTHLVSDIQVVLSPLTAPSSSTQNFGNGDWLAISRKKIFLSRTDYQAEPKYRRSPMTTIATDKPLLALSEVIAYDHVAVCWSQTPFTVHIPTKEVLNKIRSSGSPPLSMVWRHLDHLREMIQYLKQEDLQSFLSDLHSTYAYLQDHLEESRFSFNLKESAIWLNIDSSEGEFGFLDNVKSSWHKIENLVLSSSCDAGSIRAVRASLMRYEKLLRALGCNNITYPTVTRPSLHHNHSVSTSLRKLRDKGKLLDVTFFTEGKFIQAHRVVLAAMSERFESQFSGVWEVEGVIKFDEEDDPLVFLSYHTLSTMINYAYEDQVDWSEMEVSDDDDMDARDEKLDMLLDLHKGADYWVIPSLASQVEDKIILAGRRFINIKNVEAVRQRAEDVRAGAVEKMCSQFIRENRCTVQRVANSLN